MKLDMYHERFEYIETRLYWGEGVTANELADTFGISRQAAQNTIGVYRSNYPGQMEYKATERKHRASDHFTPRLIRTKNPLLFLDYLRGHSLSKYYREERSWSDLDIFDADRYLSPKNMPLDPVKTVVSCLIHHHAVMIDYRMKDMKPGATGCRVISPNHIVHADDRYHLRAYCHSRNYFLDFVLSRIIYAEKAEDVGWVSSSEDNGWNEKVRLRFKPNPNLRKSTQYAVLKHYDSEEEGVRIINCKEALKIYIERKLLAYDPKYGMPLWIRCH
ncbi:MAG: WYL domain-containing protein [Bacteroidetes bacterium]|nr:WYL domain-containing protein [Bacteroidota bacterium]